RQRSLLHERAQVLQTSPVPAGGASGRRTVKRAPFGGCPLFDLRFSAKISPLWLTTISREIDRPSPEFFPRFASVSRRSLSTLSKICPSLSGGMPGPSSSTAISTLLPLGCARTVIIPPSGEKESALSIRFVKT